MEGLTNRGFTESLCRALKDRTDTSNLVVLVKRLHGLGVCWKVRCVWDTLKSAGLHCRGLQYAGTMLILSQSTHLACFRCFFSAERRCCRLLFLLVPLMQKAASVRCHVPCFHGWVNSKACLLELIIPVCCFQDCISKRLLCFDLLSVKLHSNRSLPLATRN